MNGNAIQVDPGLYLTPGYCHPQRFAAFGYQIREVLDAQPASVLEIGVGCGIVAHTLRACNVPVHTLDLDPALRPTVAGSVTRLPFADRSFDVVLCCEVLEHLPYELAEEALGELRRVTQRCVILSVPDKTRCYRFELTIPKFGQVRRWMILPKWRAPVHQFDGEHYWELGKRGFPVERMCGSIRSAGLTLVKTYRLWEHAMHRMFVAKRTPGVGPTAPGGDATRPR